MNGYYMVFEADNNRIGVAPQSTSAKPTLYTDNKPTKVLKFDDF